MNNSIRKLWEINPLLIYMMLSTFYQIPITRYHLPTLTSGNHMMPRDLKRGNKLKNVHTRETVERIVTSIRVETLKTIRNSTAGQTRSELLCFNLNICRPRSIAGMPIKEKS